MGTLQNHMTFVLLFKENVCVNFDKFLLLLLLLIINQKSTYKILW